MLPLSHQTPTCLLDIAKRKAPCCLKTQTQCRSLVYIRQRFRSKPLLFQIKHCFTVQTR